VLTARVIRNVIDAAKKTRQARDRSTPKSANFAIYRGAHAATPNRKEFAEPPAAAPIPTRASPTPPRTRCISRLRGDAGDAKRHGMRWLVRGGEAIHVRHSGQGARRLGAGDTVAAALALSLAAKADWETALRMANAAAAVAVGKKGTAIVTVAELRRKILPHAFAGRRRKDRRRGRRSRRASWRLAQAGPAHRIHHGCSISCIPATSRF